VWANARGDAHRPTARSTAGSTHAVRSRLGVMIGSTWQTPAERRPASGEAERNGHLHDLSGHDRLRTREIERGEADGRKRGARGSDRRRRTLPHLGIDLTNE